MKESQQILIDERDHWKHRALAAEQELRTWYGYVNKTVPKEKAGVLQRLARIFAIKKSTP